jgi:predicted nucleic acid-binding protein
VTDVVVDSSVAVKWFVPEVLSQEAAHLLDGSFELMAPDLLFAEFGSVLWKKITRGEIRTDEAGDILAALDAVPLVVVSSSRLGAAALEIAVAYERTVYDALYLALAVARDCTFITADDRLARALGRGPLACHVRALSSPAWLGRSVGVSP